MKKIYTLIIVSILMFSLASCNILNSEYKMEINDNLTATTIDDNYRVFYQLFIGSFSDSNNDGIGDIKGIINRFDYLNDGKPNSGKSLGIEGLWLSPMMPSSSYHKYDVKNYYDIDRNFGNLEDFIKLLNLAHQRDVKVIIDLVVNHTSSGHPWFIEYKKSYKNDDLDNPYRDYYTTYHKDELDYNRTYYPIYSNSDYYYEGNFSSDMPELNFDNPKVRDEFEGIVKFWLELGVDGFRLDATKYVYYKDNNKNIEFWDWFTNTAKKYNENVYIVGETWSSESEILLYYKNFNNFDFSFSQIDGLIAQATKTMISTSEYTSYVEDYLNKVHEVNPNAIISPFIANHDMDRASGFLNLHNGDMFMAANLYILGPGNPYIYYGEEIGLKGTRGTANTDANRRLKMLWGDKDKVSDPVGATYNSSLQTNGTVKAHLKDKNSLYNHYKELIQIRKAYPEIARGSYKALQTEIYTVGGFISSYNNSDVIVIHNTGQAQQSIDLDELLNINFSSFIFIGLGKANISNNVLTIDGQTTIIIKGH